MREENGKESGEVKTERDVEMKKEKVRGVVSEAKTER
jgi:hypothetical protein